MNRYDRFTIETLRGGLEDGEEIRLLAFLHQSSIRMAELGGRELHGDGRFFAAATDRRLALIATENGWWRVKTVNRGISQIRYGDIASFEEAGLLTQRSFTITTRGGKIITLGINTVARFMQHQREFVRELPRLIEAWRSQ